MLAERNKLETFKRSSIIQITAGLVFDTRGHRVSYRSAAKRRFTIVNWLYVRHYRLLPGVFTKTSYLAREYA